MECALLHMCTFSTVDIRVYKSLDECENSLIYLSTSLKLRPRYEVHFACVCSTFFAIPSGNTFSLKKTFCLNPFQKVIDGGGNLTFSTFLEKFHAKAAKNGIAPRSELNCIFSISTSTNKVHRKFAAPVKKLMDQPKFNQLMNRVPVGMMVVVEHVADNDDETSHKQVIARGFLRNEIYHINNNLREKIDQLNMEICAEIANKPIATNDKMFDTWFMLWDKNDMDEEYLKKIEREIRAITIRRATQKIQAKNEKN